MGLNGNVNLTPATQQKISTYDRYICDGIFEHLEQQDKISEEQVDAEEVKLEEKREVVETKMEEAHEEALEETKETEEPAEPNTEKAKKSDSMWDLFDF